MKILILSPALLSFCRPEDCSLNERIPAPAVGIGPKRCGSDVLEKTGQNKEARIVQSVAMRRREGVALETGHVGSQ